MSEESTFGGHNYHADYRFKLTSGMKADGSSQLKELTVRSDVREGLIDIIFEIKKDWYITGKKKHFKMVSPWEDGYEPTI
ncbi:hypothetical protein LCGC14_1054800 [marine sediment metagenome]|uniref:Uncharacterized protein n=1 Tax=marine sediment metagenome TaxID=412755 RepID=A0A0F9MSC1_9ZZZZ